ncbi:MAG: hypothetical protein ACE5IZ_10290, partial [Dehalococcoidia bacterium]
SEGPGDEFKDLLSWAACVADAQPVADYVRFLESAGFRLLDAREHNDVMAATLAEVRKRLLLAATMARMGRSQPGLAALAETGQELVEEGKRLLQQAMALVEEGRLGYCLLVLAKEG